MINEQCIISGFRSPDINNYPKLFGYKKHQLYDGFIGCGGLFLADKMMREMNLKSGDIVLDLGSGLGAASLYLAQHYNITVIAVDLWHSHININNENLSGKIIPMQIEITKEIPFEENYFDAIFSMNAFFMFGGNKDFILKLLKTLKTGGVFCLGSECFDQEPDAEAQKAFDFQWKWDVWDECFSKYHSPDWWKKLFDETNQININYCRTLDDGEILWEDIAVNYYDYYDKIIETGHIIPQNKIVDLIIYGKQNGPRLTIFILSGIKKAD